MVNSALSTTKDQVRGFFGVYKSTTSSDKQGIKQARNRHPNLGVCATIRLKKVKDETTHAKIVRYWETSHQEGHKYQQDLGPSKIRIVSAHG